MKAASTVPLSGTFRKSGTFRLAERVSSILTTHPWRCLWIFVGLLFLISVGRAVRTMMWIDELYTFYIVQQPTASDVISAVREGCDGAPPLYALIVRMLTPIFGTGAWVLRMPSTIGFCGMCVFVFAFAYRRLPGIYAALATLIACASTVSYAWEARAYGLVLGLVALAFLCWQTAAGSSRRGYALAGLSSSLAMAISLHYFAVFVLVPLAAGELARGKVRRRLDFPVLGAICAPVLALVPHLPLIRASKKFIAYYHSKVYFYSLANSYLDYTGTLLVTFVCALALYAVWQLRPGDLEVERPPRGPGLQPQEWVFCIVLALTPFLVFTLELFTDEIFVTRYVLPSVIGIAVLASAALFRAARGSSFPAASAVMCLGVWLGIITVLPLPLPRHFREGEEIHRLLMHAPAEPVPIVVAHHHRFMEVYFYSEPGVRQRLNFLVNADLERRYTKTDTSSLIFTALRNRSSIPFRDYDAFVAANPKFLLAANNDDWLLWHLQRSGFRVTPVGSYSDPALFEVEAPTR